MQHLTQLLISSLRTCQLQIVTHRAAHQRVALRHENEVFSSMLINRQQRLIIAKNSDFTGIWLDECKHQAEQGGLADACSSHDSGLTAWTEVVREMAKYSPIARSIGKTDIASHNSHRPC